jgi:hypothetical protein
MKTRSAPSTQHAGCSKVLAKELDAEEPIDHRREAERGHDQRAGCGTARSAKAAGSRLHEQRRSEAHALHARQAGLATSVTMMPTKRDDHSLVAKMIPVFGSVKPIAVKNPNRPFASRSPWKGRDGRNRPDHQCPEKIERRTPPVVLRARRRELRVRWRS